MVPSSGSFKNRLRQKPPTVAPGGEAGGAGEAGLLGFANVPLHGVDWLWSDWLPRGKTTLLAGAGGSGKGSDVAALAPYSTLAHCRARASPNWGPGSTGKVLNAWLRERAPSHNRPGRHARRNENDGPVVRELQKPASPKTPLGALAKPAELAKLACWDLQHVPLHGVDWLWSDWLLRGKTTSSGANREKAARCSLYNRRAAMA